MHVNQDKLLEAVCGNAKEFDAIVSSIEVRASTGGMQNTIGVLLLIFFSLSLSYRFSVSCR